MTVTFRASTMIAAKHVIRFSVPELRDAARRIEKLLKFLVDIEDQRGQETSIAGGGVNLRALIKLQTKASDEYKQFGERYWPLLTQLSSFEEVWLWGCDMYLSLKNTQPILFDDQALDRIADVDVSLTRATHVLQKWFEELSHEIANRTVFIVHGHDEARKQELKRFLRDLGVDPVILHEKDSLGKTIIEKFEHYAPGCVFAFVLLTPDDPQAPRDQSPEQAWRARQNVIMELGWFIGRLGRERVILIHRGAVEIPTDLLGVLYLPIAESVTEVSEQIRQRLEAHGLIGPR